MPTGTQEHARGMLETAKKSSHFWAFAYVQEVEPLLDRLQRAEAVVEAASQLEIANPDFKELYKALAAWEEGKT